MNNLVQWRSSQITPEVLDSLQQAGSSTTHPVVDVVMPYIDQTQAQQTAEILLSRAGVPMRLIAVLDDAGLGFIRIANLVFQASPSPYFVYLAQDAFPGRFWLKIALDCIQHNNQGLLAFNDGKWFGQLAAFGMVNRAWAETIYDGPLFCPEYHSHYADTELTVIAQAQQQLAYSPHALLVEVDHQKDKRPTHADDKRLFAQRKTTGLNGKVSNPEWLNKFS
jgi:hypothetical protein